MRIAICNVSGRDAAGSRVVSDVDFLYAVNAIGVQFERDFLPIWGGTVELVPVVDAEALAPDVDAIDGTYDAMIYVSDRERLPGALGYHAANRGGIPFGVVNVPMPDGAGQAWTTILSHEALELFVNPSLADFREGPRPGGGRALYPLEVCDAVQADEYLIGVALPEDGPREVRVSSFVTPAYFVEGSDPKTNAFAAGPVPSFGAAPGGYVAYVDLTAGLAVTRFRDALARTLHREKARVGAEWRRLARCSLMTVLASAPRRRTGGGSGRARARGDASTGKLASRPNARRAGARGRRRP